MQRKKEEKKGAVQFSPDKQRDVSKKENVFAEQTKERKKYVFISAKFRIVSFSFEKSTLLAAAAANEILLCDLEIVSRFVQDQTYFSSLPWQFMDAIEQLPTAEGNQAHALRLLSSRMFQKDFFFCNFKQIGVGTVKLSDYCIGFISRHI
jgi:hypothetical protein